MSTASSEKLTIFTLATARSGTVYLRHLFRHNVPECVTRHEPFFDWGNPTMFGRAIYDAWTGRVEPIRRLLLQKRRYIERLPGMVYLESSHAFLKSAWLAALDVFPDLRLVHLIRDPLKVAKSAAYREAWRRRVHAPFHFYRGADGRRHFVWALTGNEEIFGAFAGTELTLFQWYLVETIEIENRAMAFLAQHQLERRCFTLHSPAELNDPTRVKAMFDFLGLPTRSPEVVLSGRKNRSFGYSRTFTQEEERQSAAVLERLPARYLEIFGRPPYSAYPWSARFRKCLELGAPSAVQST